jgi:PAS domain S-box-containing protein
MLRVIPTGIPQGRSRAAMAYAASLAGVALAIVVTLAMAPLFGGASFLFLVIPVAASAALAGLGPGVASAVAAAVAYFYLLVPRLGAQGSSAARLIVFIAVAVLIIILSDSSRRATARARDQRRWLEVTISSIGDAVIATDTAGVVSLMNTVAEDLTGWRSDEGVGTPLREVYRTIDEDTRVPLASPDGHTLGHESPQLFTGQTVLITRSGREVPIDANVAPIRDEQGGIQGMILVFHDISQRRRSEQELLQSEERLRLSQQAGRIATWEWNLTDGRFSWSENIAALLGHSPGCFEGDPRSCLELVHPEDRDRVVETARHVRQERTPFEIEFRVIQADGNFRWLSGKGQAFPGQGGRPGRIIGVARDVTARRHAEEALRASEERFYKAFNSSPLPKWISRLDTGEMIDVNEAFLRSTGFEREEVLGQVPGRFGLWDSAEDLRLAGMVRRKSSGRDLEFRFRRKSGQARIFLLSFELITLDREPCLLAVANDITERKQAEEALRESEERFRLMADTAPVMIWLSGPDTLYTYFNRSWLDFTGRALGEELGNGWSGGVHPDDLQACLQTRAEAFYRRAKFETEYRLRRADGEYRWVVDVGVPRLTSEGTFAGYIGSCLDITERRKAEQERERLLDRAEAARRRAALLAEASAILASSLEYQTSLQSVAELAVNHFADWCTVDVIEDGATSRVALAQRDGDELEKAALATEPHALSVLKTGRPEIVPVAGGEEGGTSTRPGRATSWMCVPLMARGRILGALTLVAAAPRRTYSDEDLSLAQDLADRAAMAVENVQLLRQAQQANRTKDEFLATVSHELRTPLNSILGWAKMLGTGRLDQANSSRAVEIIERNAKAQAQLIEDLLDISRIISGKLRLDVRSVDLVPIIESAVDAVRLAAESKGIRIQRVLDSGIGPISGDPDRLQQVVWNLLSNAIKFTPREGRVQVRLEKIGSAAHIVVSDTGIGISPEFLPDVFERFRQGDSSSTRKHGGLGLGLAIASQLIELHGGGISVKSEGTGNGAVFTVSLPIPAAGESGGRMQPGQTPAAPGVGSPVLEGIRVLVVEDDTDTREVMTLILQQCGAEVRGAASAGEAFDILCTDWVPHVLVSDIEMPGEDGYALIRRVRAREATHGGRIPAAALTAYARSEDRMRAQSAGFQAHVPKPVEPAELIAVVASLAGRISLMQARN